MSRGDIADYLGLTTETVCRTLTKLRTRGLIALPKTYRIVLLSPSSLMEITGEHDEWNGRLAAGTAVRRPARHN
jgi:CRP/FNR family transcriptional regulator